jgi:hypothetical protein
LMSSLRRRLNGTEVRTCQQAAMTQGPAVRPPPCRPDPDDGTVGNRSATASVDRRRGH